ILSHAFKLSWERAAGGRRPVRLPPKAQFARNRSGPCTAQSPARPVRHSGETFSLRRRRGTRCAAPSGRLAARYNSQAKGQRATSAGFMVKPVRCDLQSFSTGASMSTQTPPLTAASAPPAQLNRTPLFAAHQAAGAKMVDFGGWEMPISYGSQLAEHHAVRQNAGMFDVSHMLNVDITGLQARRFLSLLLANDVAKLAISGKALYSCMLDPEGGVIDDLIVYFFNDDRWRVVVNAGCAQKDLNWMQRVVSEHKLDVAITPRRDLAMIAVQGPQARERVWQIHPEWQ